MPLPFHFNKLLAVKLQRNSYIYALILSVLASPLQAIDMFDCEMRDTTFIETCCCEDSDSGDESSIISDTCCEESSVLYIDTDAFDEITNINLLEFHSNVDPPPIISFSAEHLLESGYTTVTHDYFLNFPCKLGTSTYLITQRLRI